MSTIDVRAARPEDLDDLVAFNLGLARETEGKELDEATLRRGVEAVLADPGRGRYFLAWRGGRTVGGLMLTYEWSDWRDGVFWWIQSVYVRAAERGGGVFRALYDEVVRRAAAEPGVVGLRLYVERENRRAQGVYEAVGMQRSHYRLYELELGPAPPAGDR